MAQKLCLQTLMKQILSGTNPAHVILVSLLLTENLFPTLLWSSYYHL